MKCVGLLVFVLLVQSVDQFFRVKHRKWNYSPIPATKVPNISKNINNLADKAAILDIFRSEMNNTHGIVIPNDLLLQVPFSDVSANLLTSFRTFQQTLTDLSGCKSKYVSSVAAALYKLLDTLTKSIGSLSTDRVSLSNVISELFHGITDAIAILDMGSGISDAIEKIKVSLLDVIRVLDENKSTESNITKKLNDAVFSLTLSVQVLVISTGVIAESGAKKLATITAEVKEAVVSLTLILQAIIVVVQNAISSIASSVPSSPNNPSAALVLNSFVVIIDRALPEMTNVLAAITSSSIISSSSLIVSTISLTLNSVITRFNDSIGKLQTSIGLDVPNTLENLLFNLIGSEADFVSYVSTSTATIVSSIVAISSSDGGMHSKIARQLYSVYQGLLQLGPEHDIVFNVTNLLPSILDVLKAATSNLLYCIGSELTNALSTCIEEIFTTLQRITAMLGQADISDEAMDETAKECAKSVQVFGSVVVTLTDGIFSSINSTNAAAQEAVIALPILHSTLLYVVEWVTVITSSILKTKGNGSEVVPSLAVTIVAILKQDASILEMIAAAATRNVSDIVTFIATTVNELAKTNSQLSSISQITAKTSVQIEQISTGSTDIAVEGITKTTSGDLSQILSGLTGSMSSISSTFSSSLNGLRNSFKQIASSEFEILQSLSAVLDSIAKDLSDISGSATQILHLTSALLHSFFGRLVESTSRLSKLGDLVAPLCTAIANISTALHSLIHAIRNYNLTSCFIIDSFRELAKTIQIIVSTFSAVITSAANVDSAVLNIVSVEIAALPYLVSTIILCVQQVVGAAIPAVSEASGTIGPVQDAFTVTVSSILENLTSITAETTTFVTDGILASIPSNILSSVSNVNGYTSASLGKISGVAASIQVTLANKAS